MVILMFTKNSQVHGYTIVAFPQRSIPEDIKSKEGMVGLTCATLLQWVWINDENKSELKTQG
jgi:hypothetical protein